MNGKLRKAHGHGLNWQFEQQIEILSKKWEDFLNRCKRSEKKSRNEVNGKLRKAHDYRLNWQFEQQNKILSKKWEDFLKSLQA